MAENNKNKVKLCSFDLDCDLSDFVDVFWSTKDFHTTFVQETFDEKVLAVSDWIEDNNESKDGYKVISYSRVIQTHHPLPISLPWLPVYVTNELKQTIRVKYNFCKNDSKTFFKLEISEKSVIDGIPWIQPKVWTDWLVQDICSDNKNKIHIDVYLWFEDQGSSFDVISPLVEIHSSSELSKYFKHWEEKAIETVKSKNNEMIDSQTFPTIYEQLKNIMDVLHELETVQLEHSIQGIPSPRSSPKRRKTSQHIEQKEITTSDIHLLNLLFLLSVFVLFAKGVDSTLRVAISMLLKKVKNFRILYYMIRIVGSILIGCLSGLFCNYLKRQIVIKEEETKQLDHNYLTDSDEIKEERSIEFIELPSHINAKVEPTSAISNAKANSFQNTIDVILYPVHFFASLHNTPIKSETSNNQTHMQIETETNNNDNKTPIHMKKVETETNDKTPVKHDNVGKSM